MPASREQQMVNGVMVSAVVRTLRQPRSPGLSTVKGADRERPRERGERAAGRSGPL